MLPAYRPLRSLVMLCSDACRVRAMNDLYREDGIIWLIIGFAKEAVYPVLMNVSLHFKKSGDDVRLLVIYSTEDGLGKNIAKELCDKLSPAVEIVSVEEATNFRSLSDIIDENSDFNVLLVIAHGDKLNHKFWLHEDEDSQGNELGISAGELKAILEGKVDDKLVMFGTCYCGTDDLASLMLGHVGVLACVAPKPNCTITDIQVAEWYSWLLNKIQAAKANDVGPYELKDFTSHPDFVKSLKILSVSPQV